MFEEESFKRVLKREKESFDKKLVIKTLKIQDRLIYYIMIKIVFFKK